MSNGLIRVHQTGKFAVFEASFVNEDLLKATQLSHALTLNERFESLTVSLNYHLAMIASREERKLLDLMQDSNLIYGEIKFESFSECIHILKKQYALKAGSKYTS